MIVDPIGTFFDVPPPGIKFGPCRGYMLMQNSSSPDKWSRMFFAILENRLYCWTTEEEYLSSVKAYLDDIEKGERNAKYVNLPV